MLAAETRVYFNFVAASEWPGLHLSFGHPPPRAGEGNPSSARMGGGESATN